MFEQTTPILTSAPAESSLTDILVRKPSSSNSGNFARANAKHPTNTGGTNQIEENIYRALNFCSRQFI